MTVAEDSAAISPARAMADSGWNGTGRNFANDEADVSNARLSHP